MDSSLRRNQSFNVLVLMICAIAMVGFGSRAAVAAEPPSINPLVSLTSELNAQQRRQLADYAQYWSAALLSEDMDYARRAKRRLVEPFGLLGVRRIFRDEYARAAMPELNKVIDSNNNFAAVNAVQVAIEFRNEAALSLMRERCGARESRWQIRLWAARGIGRIAAEAEDIPSRTIIAAVRDLSRAGETETHWLVLQRQFEALATINNEQSREAQVSLLRTTLNRIAADSTTPSEMMQAVHRALLLLRNQLLDPSLPSAQLRALGTETGPLLGQIFDIGIMHWDNAIEDRDVRASYNGAISVSKNLLELIDSQVRGPAAQRPRFNTAWGNGNKSNFEADVAQWRQVLRAPPYAR